MSMHSITVSPSSHPSTPTIRIYTPPASPRQSTPATRIYTPPSPHNEEWDSMDDFSVDSLPADGSSTSSNVHNAITPPEEIERDEQVEYSDAPRSSSDFLQKMGHWLYNSRVVQYMKYDDRSRVKTSYSAESIWMLGVVYSFTESGGVVNLPKPDKGENARSGRPSSLFNFVFGPSSDDEFGEAVKSHERHHSEDLGKHRLNKSRSYSQSAHDFIPPSPALPSGKGKGNAGTAVIRRLRSLSFTRKTYSPDRRSYAEGTPLPAETQNDVRLPRPHPLNRKSESMVDLPLSGRSGEFNMTDGNPTPTSNNLLPVSRTSRRMSVGHNILRVLQLSPNQGSEPSSPTKASPPRSEHSAKYKKPRRMTFTGFFSGKEKKYGSSLPSPSLYPHAEVDHDGSNSKEHELDFKGIGMSQERDGRIFSDDMIFSDDSDSSDTIADRRDLRCQPSRDASSFGHKDVSNGKARPLFDRKVSLSLEHDVDHARGNSDTGSLRSTRSMSSPTSLYQPNSFGPLTSNQTKLLEFLLNFQSRIFCCYRKDFPRIEPAFHTADTGWGCMHRTGQSLLAQGFVYVLLGRDWRIHHEQTDTSVLMYRKIIRWFLDGPEPEQYYSIHNIARAGMQLDKKIGDWFAPSTVAHALKRLSLMHKECPLVIHVATDNTIYRSEVIASAFGEKEGLVGRCRTWKPVLIMIPVRLGTDKLNASYSHNLKTLFTFPQFLGIAGGRPGRSLYFVAIQDSEIMYLDPHFVRPAIDLDECEEFPIEDYHSTVVRAMNISEMDPSMLLGFLCQSEREFNDLCSRIQRDMDEQFPFFTILDASLQPGTWSSGALTAIGDETIRSDVDDDDDVPVYIESDDDNNVDCQEVASGIEDDAVMCPREASDDDDDGVLSARDMSDDDHGTASALSISTTASDDDDHSVVSERDTNEDEGNCDQKNAVVDESHDICVDDELGNDVSFIMDADEARRNYPRMPSTSELLFAHLGVIDELGNDASFVIDAAEARRNCPRTSSESQSGSPHLGAVYTDGDRQPVETASREAHHPRRHSMFSEDNYELL